MTATRSIKPFGLRMNPDIKAWIEEQATKNGRSMNSEIIQMLKQVKESLEHPTSQGNYELRSN